MKTRILAVILVVMVLSVLFVNGPQAEADVHSEALSVLAVDELFTALNAGDTDSALGSFAHGATVENRARRETYLDVNQISGMLESWHKEGRQYGVLQDEVTNVTTGLDIVTFDVEISDSGVAWGRETFMAVVHNDQIQKLYAKDIQLTPWQYW